MTEIPAAYVTEQRPPYGASFLAFSGNTPQDEAVARYQDRYGQPPANIIKWHGGLYLGPVPTKTEQEIEND